MAKLLHVNLNSFKARKPELSVLVQELKPHIVSLNETKSPVDGPPPLLGYRVASRADISSHQGGVAILIKHGITYTKINFPKHPQRQAVGITVKINNTEVAIISYYNSTTLDPTVFSDICNKYQQCIILGDLNSKHQTFGCKTTDHNGDILFNCTEQHNLLKLNGPEPTFFRNQYSELLDYVLATPKISSWFNSCYITDCIGSDHAPILTEFKTGSNLTSTPLKTITQYKGIKWPQCNQDIINQLTKLNINQPIPNAQTLEQLIHTSGKIIATTIEKHAPKIKIKPYADTVSPETLNLI